MSFQQACCGCYIAHRPGLEGQVVSVEEIVMRKDRRTVYFVRQVLDFALRLLRWSWSVGIA